MPLKDKVVSSVKWNTVAIVYSMVIQLLRLVVLTRFLEKADFGLVAIATMIISFTDIFSDLGITVALIHKQDVTEQQYSSVFWLNIFMSFALYGVVCALTPFIANYYSEEVLLVIVPLFSIQILLNSFGKMFQTIKTKELEFGFLSKVRIVSQTAGFILTVVLAYLGYGIYSIVWGQLFHVAINQVCYIVAGRKGTKISFHFKISEIRSILSIGVFQLGPRIFDVAASKIDVMLVGRFFGMEDLGVYNLAKELVSRPIQIFQQLVSNVATSAFAKIQTDRVAVRRSLSTLLHSITFIAFPVFLMMAIFADPIINILYSNKFADAAFFLRVLSITGVFITIEGIASSLLASYGKTKTTFLMTLLHAMLSISVVFITSAMTIKALAYGQVFIALISYFLYWRLAIKQTIDMPLGAYMNPAKTPLLVTLLSSIPFVIVSCFWHYSTFVGIVLATVFGIAYLSLYYVIDKQFVVNTINTFMKRK